MNKKKNELVQSLSARKSRHKWRYIFVTIIGVVSHMVRIGRIIDAIVQVIRKAD